MKPVIEILPMKMSQKMSDDVSDRLSPSILLMITVRLTKLTTKHELVRSIGCTCSAVSLSGALITIYRFRNSLFHPIEDYERTVPNIWNYARCLFARLGSWHVPAHYGGTTNDWRTSCLLRQDP